MEALIHEIGVRLEFEPCVQLWTCGRTTQPLERGHDAAATPLHPTGDPAARDPAGRRWEKGNV